MGNLTSTYTIDLVVKDDDTKKAINDIRAGLGKIGKSVDMSDASKQLESLMSQVDGLIKSDKVNTSAIFKNFARDAEKTANQLEKQILSLRQQEKAFIDLKEEEIKLEKIIAEKTQTNDQERVDAEQKLIGIKHQLEKINQKELKDQIKNNLQIRARLKTVARLTEADMYRQKLETLRAKKDLKYFSEERKENNKTIKQLKEKIALIEKEEKAKTKVASATKRLNKLQAVYNVAGLVGGAARTIGAGGRGIVSGIGGGIKTATGIARAGASVIGAGLSSATAAADREVEMEQMANRVKGVPNNNEAKQMLSDLYIRTGADYSVIVDAINRVQTVMKSPSKEAIKKAAEVEIKYPGMSAAFAASTTTATDSNINIFANRMKAIQKASGATDEQLQASMAMVTSLNKPNMSNANATDLQAVYLGLQTSGAFDNQDELDKAFDLFLSKLNRTNKSAAELATEFDWQSVVSNQRNKTRIINTMSNMDWNAIMKAASTDDASDTKRTEAESTAIQMRRMEEQKNKLLMTLIPAAIPLVEALAEVLDGSGAKEIAEGLGSLFKVVTPILIKVLKFLEEHVFPYLGAFLRWLQEKFASDDGAEVVERVRNAAGVMPQNSAGGLALMPSIVGERGPEAIIPLDFARSQRASNIATSINQTFNMGSNATTALSLAQTVRSRDFTRAMAENAFITRRCGVF